MAEEKGSYVPEKRLIRDRIDLTSKGKQEEIFPLPALPALAVSSLLSAAGWDHRR